MKSSLVVNAEPKFVLPRREMCTLSLARSELRVSGNGPVCTVVQHHTARTVINNGRSIVSKSDPSSPVRKPTGTKLCSSAATPSLSLGAHGTMRRRLLR